MEDFNTPLIPMDRSTKQKINKETQTLNDTIEQSYGLCERGRGWEDLGEWH